MLYSAWKSGVLVVVDEVSVLVVHEQQSASVRGTYSSDHDGACQVHGCSRSVSGGSSTAATALVTG